MRTTVASTRGSLDALMPRTRQLILTAALLSPDRSWYIRDLARHLQVTPSTLQRDLAALVRAGVLTRRRDGNRVYYQADPNCPILPDLQSLLAKTAGLADVIRRTLKPWSRAIGLALIYGSVARGEHGSGSDVDLLVVGEVGLADLAPALRSAEKQLLRPVNPLIYSREEFASKLRSGDHLVKSILRSPVMFLIGDARELEQLTGHQPHSAARDKQRRG